MNNRGQMMIVGILVLVIAVIVFLATVPAMQNLTDTVRGCSYFNCNGYVDSDTTSVTCGSGNQTYTDAVREDAMGCTLLDLAVPLLILIVIVGIAAALIRGKLVEPEQPSY